MGLNAFKCIFDAILDFCHYWNNYNMYTFQIYIFYMNRHLQFVYNFEAMHNFTNKLEFMYIKKTERNIQPINMVHYISRPTTIFKDILTQNSPINGSRHIRVHHKYSQNQYCVVHAILLLRSNLYIVN